MSVSNISRPSRPGSPGRVGYQIDTACVLSALWEPGEGVENGTGYSALPIAA